MGSAPKRQWDYAGLDASSLAVSNRPATNATIQRPRAGLHRTPSKHETATGEMKIAVRKSWTAHVSSGVILG
jgi:hypothetical protein